MIDHDLQVRSTALEARKSCGLLNEEEMAALLHLNSVSTLATWRSQKKGPPFVKLGKRVFYTINDFRTWVVEEAHKAHANDNQPTDQKVAA